MKNIYNVLLTKAPASFKDVDSKKGIVTGYFASFNNVDSDGDIILPGAFTKTIKDNGPASLSPRIKHLLNHNVDQPLGKILSLEEDAKGLAYESQVGTHTLGQDFIKMVESDLITEHSIGFRKIKEEKDATNEDVNLLKELQLWEGSSLTAWGANDLTPLTGMKSEFDVNTLIERQKRLEKFCKNTTASDETIEMLLLHMKQLNQIILDIQNTTKAAVVAPLPDSDSKELFDALTIFKNNLI